ncbi:MAG TPA: hypothetical protein VKL61_05390 [Candidatus Polarisedimenticolia bacterium]|nr:hypothetical protein [Candidatus Polarisedimenticolia bacterium]
MPPPVLPRRVVFLRIVRQIQSKGRSFLALKRLRVRNEYEDGRLSRPYAFEMVERRGIDSVALIPFRHGRERIWILIKAGFRPALFQRGLRRAPGEGIRPRPLTFEAVAGSLEPDEWTDSQIDRRALFELEEETGFRAKPADLISLGAGFFPSHGQCTEKIHLRGVRLDRRRHHAPRGDGSVNESETWTLWVEAVDLIGRCRKGEIEDPKVEIGVQRLLDCREISQKRIRTHFRPLKRTS